jgi:hypothetical protein
VKKLGSFVLLAALATTGCYHAIIETGRSPSGQSIERAWAHGFLYGLVPPSVTETASQCPNGVARVETKHSFLNALAGGITWGIYTPMTIQVQCAASAPDDGADLLGPTDGDTQSLIETAARRSIETGEAVYVDLR